MLPTKKSAVTKQQEENGISTDVLEHKSITTVTAQQYFSIQKTFVWIDRKQCLGTNRCKYLMYRSTSDLHQSTKNTLSEQRKEVCKSNIAVTSSEQVPKYKYIIIQTRVYEKRFYSNVYLPRHLSTEQENYTIFS